MFAGLSQQVEIYDIKTDSWSFGPQLVRVRHHQSSCIQGNRWMYTIGGFKSDTFERHDRSIERLDIRYTLSKGAATVTQNASISPSNSSDISQSNNGNQAIGSWEVLNVKLPLSLFIKNSFSTLIAAVNQSKIVIFGQNVATFDTESMSIEQEEFQGSKLEGFCKFDQQDYSDGLVFQGNLCFQVARGRTVAFVSRFQGTN